ncbi:MAG: hypothetical protein IJG84_03055 [Kiritimatiellae bacterium]|nr:hypothetical protein [Kiritimatiellia bacterium]
MKKLMMATAIAAVACGCIVKQPIPRGVDALTDEDISMMVGHAMEKIYKDVNVRRMAGKSPNVRIVAKIQPFEMPNLPDDTRTREIASELEMRLCKEMTDGGLFIFPDAAGGAASGAALQPDYILKGKLSCMIKENDISSTSEFKLQLDMVDVRTGIATWRGTVALAKRSE